MPRLTGEPPTAKCATPLRSAAVPATVSQSGTTRGRPLSVLLVDDDPLVRAGLRTILSSASDLDVVAEAADGAAAITAVRTRHVDVALMDVRMPGVDGITATKQITVLPDPPKVIVPTTFSLDEYVFGALRAGASGFLLKDTPPADIVGAVRLVAAGDAMLSPSVTRTLIDHNSADTTQASRTAAEKSLKLLTERSRRRGGARPVQRRHRRPPVHERGNRQGPRIPHPDQAERGQPRTSGDHDARRGPRLSRRPRDGASDPGADSGPPGHRSATAKYPCRSAALGASATAVPTTLCDRHRAARSRPHLLPQDRASQDMASPHRRRSMAVEVGFEPTEGLPLHTLSRRAPSATRRLHRR
jgi:DNA-binding NarL/FixJ family response regulator